MNRGDVEEIHRRASKQVVVSFELLAHARMAERVYKLHVKTSKMIGVEPNREMGDNAALLVHTAEKRVVDALDKFERDVDRYSDMLAEGR